MGTPPGKGFKGEYQSCCMLIVGLVTVPEKVTGAPELQVAACEVGFTELVGASMFCPIFIVCVVLHPAIPLLAITVYVPCMFCVKVAEVPVIELLRDIQV